MENYTKKIEIDEFAIVKANLYLTTKAIMFILNQFDKKEFDIITRYNKMVGEAIEESKLKKTMIVFDEAGNIDECMKSAEKFRNYQAKLIKKHIGKKASAEAIRNKTYKETEQNGRKQ